MSHVYVTQDVMVRNDKGELQRKFDYAPASQYGEIRILVPYGQSLSHSVPVIRQLLIQLRDFTEHDYLLPLGDPAVMAACSAIASQYCKGRLNVLKWDRREQSYHVVKFDLGGKLRESD